MDKTFDKQILASEECTSDTLTLASEDNTSDTLTLASEDNTSDTLTLASEDSTSDTLTLASDDSTSDTLTLASEDSTSDTLTLASEESTSDTLTLARVDRENQGMLEAVYSYGGEADLHGQYVNCDKNPGHKNFIPVDNFSLEDLPEDYRDNDVFDYILAVSELTVRVAVKNVSGRMVVGTGCVVLVRMYNNSKDGPCKCNECRNSTQVMDYADIHIQTACHVAFEDHDGEHTTCHLFFDRGNTPDTCSGVVTLTGTFMLARNDINDYCRIKNITHDLNLARRLEQTLKRMWKLRSICYNVEAISTYKQALGDQDRQPLLFIVSHPHGCSKQISLGRWTRADMFSNVIISILYNTATCPGSSGALVYVFSAIASQRVDGSFTGPASLLNTVHCGSSELQLDLNFCRTNRGAMKPTLVSLKMLPLDKGPLMDFFCLMEDVDTNKCYAACKRNPGHRHFVPLEKFTMENLPPVNGRDEIVKCIKLVADLTVRVTVSYVSEKRPKTVAGTNIPYPWFSNRGSKLMRLGSGWVDSVKDYTDQECPCKQCQNSLTPQQQFVLIRINTAAHLVYDELEAKHTTCDLFFDSGGTSDVCKDVVTLTDMCTFTSWAMLDVCSIVYYTHDMDLGRKLSWMIDKYRAPCRAPYMRDGVKQNGGGKTKPETTLNIVISHPHGCAKQVSIGHCDIPGNDGTGAGQCPTGDIVCPGSSGAPMLVLSRRLFYPCMQYPWQRGYGRRSCTY